LDRLQTEFTNSVFGGNSTYYTSYPPVNLYSNEEEVLLVALVPGYEPDSIDISVKENKVTIKGTQKQENVAEGVEVLRQEIFNRDFIRSIELPFTVDSSKVDAVYKNGALYVKLPKIEAEKPKKIQIKTQN
jgi:HSP20 family protein